MGVATFEVIVAMLPYIIVNKKPLNEVVAPSTYNTHLLYAVTKNLIVALKRRFCSKNH